MKIVVTGGSGQLGREVVSELVRYGHGVLSLDRRPNPDGHKPSWTADLVASGPIFEACVSVDAIVHLAAHFAPGLAPDCATFNDNVAMTYNVLKAASVLNVRRVVVASSVSAYGFLYGDKGRAPLYLPIDEEHPATPTDPYGLSKTVGEQISDSFAMSGMTIVSLRFPGVNYDRSFKRIESFMADPGHRQAGFWSYIDVRDAATVCRLSLEANISGHRIFNIAAPTSNMREPTGDLIRKYFPGLKDIRNPENKNWSGVNSDRAWRELNFRAAHVWERYLT
jgi:nucleoside-diphosphate-sugar epimerase